MTPRVLRAAPILAAASVLAVLAGCSDSGDPTPTSSATTPPSSGGGALDCGDAALLAAPTEALAAFPDNPDVDWTARPSTSSLADLVLVSLVPEPDEVGYPEFQFVYRCDAGGPSRIATYALDADTYVLLSTTDALADEEVPSALP